MIYIVLHPNKRPAEKQAKLLTASLDLHGIDYRHCQPDQIPDGAMVITDCFVMETPCGDPGHDLANNIIDRARGHNLKLVFYYPSESYATLSASFCPTAEALEKNNVTGYLIKCGDWDIDGYVKNYNMPEFFAWIINNEFNCARLGYTCDLIDSAEKTHKFLFLNGESRPNRERFFDLFRSAGLLEQSIWSHRSGKSATGHGPDSDWPDPFCHPDFRFYAYYPSHYYQTHISIVSETTQNEWFPTEKTYKSLMLGHPFVVYGGQHSLKKIRAMGFETFDQYIDESYDLVTWPQERAEQLVKSLSHCTTALPSTHNRSQFQKIANSAYKNLINILQDINNNITIKENFYATSAMLNNYFLK